jgi:hypothetical protein
VDQFLQALPGLAYCAALLLTFYLGKRINQYDVKRKLTAVEQEIAIVGTALRKHVTSAAAQKSAETRAAKRAAGEPAGEMVSEVAEEPQGGGNGSGRAAPPPEFFERASEGAVKRWFQKRFG